MIQKLIIFIFGIFVGVGMYVYIHGIEQGKVQTIINICLIAATIFGPALSFQFASWNLERETKRKFSLEIEYNNKIKMHESMIEISHILDQFDNIHQPTDKIEGLITMLQNFEKLKVVPGANSNETKMIFDILEDLNLFVIENLCDEKISLGEEEISCLEDLNIKIKKLIVCLRNQFLLV